MATKATAGSIYRQAWRSGEVDIYLCLKHNLEQWLQLRTQRNPELCDGKDDGDAGWQLWFWVREAEGAGSGERCWNTVRGISAGISKLVATWVQVLRFVPNGEHGGDLLTAFLVSSYISYLFETFGAHPDH